MNSKNSTNPFYFSSFLEINPLLPRDRVTRLKIVEKLKNIYLKIIYKKLFY